MIDYCIVRAHSLTSADNTTVDGTVEDQNRNCLCVPDLMSLLHICSQEDILVNLLHNMLEGCENP